MTYTCPKCGKKQGALTTAGVVQHICPNASTHEKRQYDGLVVMVPEKVKVS